MLVEVCNNIDDDCDGLIDEGFTKYCNRPSHPAQDLCTDPGETLCNGVDDNCNGATDEGLLNLCGTCGPAPTEICDLVDNDCDTLTDEGGVCTPGCTPTAEICNNRDDDCDTMIDDGVTRPCGSSIGECRPGTQTCTAGTWGPCAGSVGPVAETCDNRDNDCDGRTDGFTRPCGSSVGVCRPGTQLCTAGSWSADCVGAYTGGPEVCNLLDDDCDGSTDEGDPGGGGECGGSVGECLPGTRHCVGGALVCVGGRDPVPETCNNRDDDCDGSTDEGNPGGGDSCYSGPPGTDGVGICEGGVVRCLAGSLVCDGEVVPGTEDCNLLDDDCDTETDEGLASGATCGTDEGECSAGTSRCVAGAWVCEGEVGPGTETCDGRDNDCDGATDEGNPGGGLPCGWNPDDPSVWDLGICEPGISNCVDGAIRCEGMIGPAEEVCNALDDDCNGRTDDLPDTGTPCGSDVGECAAGMLQCLDGAMQCVGGRGPTPEFCDCLDNDCDGETDNGAECGGGAACIDCTCVVPCDPGIELNCPTGRVCQCGVNPENPSACYCVPDIERCGDDVCNLCEDCIGGACVETVTCDRCQRCDPATGTCVDLCAGVVCDPGLECECGRCEVPDCYSAGHECPAGYECEDGTCVEDACYDVSCPAPQFCRDGTCHDPCEVEDVCEAGQVCYDGACIPDPCYGVTCDPGEECAGGTCSSACAEVECSWPLECDPATGECEEPACWDVRCPEGYDCVNGTCYERGHRADDADGGDGGGEAGAGRQVLATGAGGCACRTTVSGGGAGGLLALLALAGLGAARGPRQRQGA
jgi:MYXO-CTERM domain-containing protein